MRPAFAHSLGIIAILGFVAGVTSPAVAAVAPLGTGSFGTNGSTTAGTTLAVTVTGAVPVGNTVIVSFAMDPTTGTVSCTDLQGNTYVQDVNIQNGSAGSGVRTVLFSSAVTTALASGNTITITHPSVTARAASVSVFSGVLGAGRLDRTATGTGSSATPATAATAATNQADELLIGTFGVESRLSSTTFAAGTGYTGLTVGTTTGMIRTVAAPSMVSLDSACAPPSPIFGS